jgi:hypothetical protein
MSYRSRTPATPLEITVETAKSGGEIVIEPEIEILLPPTVIPGLIKALDRSGL